MERESTRGRRWGLLGVLVALLLIFTVGTERASFVWSAPQQDPDRVVLDDGGPLDDNGNPDVDNPDVGVPPVDDPDENPCGADGVENPEGAQIGEWGDPADLRITEIMYNPPNASTGTLFARDDFEYIELLNIGELPLDVCGFHLSSANGMRFVFPSGMVVAPEQIAVVVKNLEAFAYAYDPCEDFLLAGEFAAGSLGNDGDVVFLVDRAGGTLETFAISHRWFDSANGDGASIHVFSEKVSSVHKWKIGAWTDGEPSPGCMEGGMDVDDSLQLPGDSNQDASLDISDVVVLLRHLFKRTTRPLPCDGPRINYGGNLLLFDVNGDYFVNVSDAMYLANALFGMGYPPVLGLQCVEIKGCPKNLECPDE